MRKTIGSFLAQRRTWEKLMRAAARMKPAAWQHDLSANRLREIRAFGSNPGALRMFAYVPPRLSADAALVVVLHGCTQTAASYDFGAGWSTLADRYGFALLLPEQQRCNNP